MASIQCRCCKEPVFDPNFIYTLPCGVKVCETCYEDDFWSGEDCSHSEPGTSPDCLDCIFSQVTTDECLTYSDADPGL